jgi:hypothetical protein
LHPIHLFLGEAGSQTQNHMLYEFVLSLAQPADSQDQQFPHATRERARASDVRIESQKRLGELRMVRKRAKRIHPAGIYASISPPRQDKFQTSGKRSERIEYHFVPG